jgi:hypothetical protein
MSNDEPIPHQAGTSRLKAVPLHGPVTAQREIGFVGLGHMGTAMATTLPPPVTR